MKNIFLIILVIMVIFSCTKKDENKNKNESELIEDITDRQEVDSKNINFEEMASVVEKSEKLDIEAFLAVSVLHKKYIDRFENVTPQMDEDEKKKFYKNKKKEFFNSIKYSESEYDEFMINNIRNLNSYINQHPEIAEYLTTIN